MESLDTPTKYPACRLCPASVQVRPVFIPSYSATLFLTSGLASVAYPCLNRPGMGKRQRKVREMQAWNGWTWRKNVAGSIETPSEQVVNRVTA